MVKKPIFYIKIFLFVVVVLFLGAYVFYQFRFYLLGPSIAIDFPKNGAALNDSFMMIKGQTGNASSLVVDGQTILTDTFGNFEKGLILAKGYNIIHLIARDKFGREVEKKLEVVLK